MKKVALIVIAAAFGVLLALVATPAQAWDISSLPSGYSVSHSVDSSPPPGVCGESYHVQGFGQSVNLAPCDGSFQAQLDAFVNSTCPCAQTTTTAAPTTSNSSTTTTTTTTTPDTTTTPAAPSTTTSPAGTTTVTVTDTTTTTTTTAAAAATVVQGSELDSRLSLVEQRLAVLEARVATLETTVQILGEPKNVAPFVEPPA